MKEKQEKQTAPHRRGHRQAGPTVVVPLQHHTPSDRVKSPDPDQTQAVSQSPPRHTTCGGLATSAVGLHLTRHLASRGASPRPPQYFESQNRLQSRYQDEEQCYPVSKNPVRNRLAAPAGRQHHVAPPTQPATAIMLATQVVVRAIFRRCTIPESPSDAEQPAIVRCGPRLPTMSLLRAPSSDVVPHRTGDCQTTPAAAVRCKQPETDTQAKTLGCRHNIGRRHEGSATPFESTTCTSRLAAPPEGPPLTTTTPAKPQAEMGL